MIHLSLKKWEDSETEGKKKHRKPMLSQNTEAHGPEDNFLLVSLKGVSHLSKPTLGSLNLDSEKILSNISQQLEETLAKSHL